MEPRLQRRRSMALIALRRARITELQALVVRHRIVYEVAPAAQILGGERRAIGFDLTLCGTHEDGAGHVMPGCRRCTPVFSALRSIAEAIMPPSGRDSGYIVNQFDRCLYSSPSRGLRYDVELVIEIRHRQGYLDSIDACERQCLAEMRRDLGALGVPSNVWAAGL